MECADPRVANDIADVPELLLVADNVQLGENLGTVRLVAEWIMVSR